MSPHAFAIAGANNLLSTLRGEEYTRIASNAQRVAVSSGDVMYMEGDRIDLLYFPTTVVLSLVCYTQSGSSVQVGIVGAEGFLSVPALLGEEFATSGAITLIGGEAIAFGARFIRDEFRRGGTLQQVLIDYARQLLTQVSQTAVCNRLHSMEQRLARWLLLCQDRAGSECLRLTQEFMSQMLGGRRETVTVAIAHLEEKRLIECARGRIRIQNREALERAACECYRAPQTIDSRAVLKRGPAARITVREAGRLSF